MSPTSLVKAVLSIFGAVILTAAALFGLRQRGTPPSAKPQPGSESPGPTPSKEEPSGLLTILGSSGIVAIVALVGTLASVVFGNINLRDQLEANQRMRATEQAEARIQQEDEQEEERGKREDERVDDLYNHAITTLASGTPVQQVVGVYELGRVIQAPVRNEYEEPVREILAGNLRVFAPVSSNLAATPAAPPVSSVPVIRAIVDVLGKQDRSPSCEGKDPSSDPASVGRVQASPRPVRANLAGVNFRDQGFADANFNDANLRTADFTNADLTLATLCNTDLTKANLYQATVTDANLRFSTLTDSDLRFSTLTHADFRNVQGNSADFRGATGANADFTDAATLAAADFSADERRSEDGRLAPQWITVLTGAVFVRAILDRAELIGAFLQDTDFTSANLRDAVLRYASLPGASFECADLSGVDLENADLVHMDDEYGIFLPEDQFSNEWVELEATGLIVPARLDPASLRGANLTGATLDRANLAGVDFTGAILTDADLIGVQLRGANFSNADLRGANFRFANDLAGAVFAGANLAGAILEDTNLAQAQLDSALVDDATMLPDRLDRSHARLPPQDWSTPECTPGESPAATPVATQ